MKYEKNTVNSAGIQDFPVALVTGGGRRIGAAIVQYLHQQGFCVAIHCHQSTQQAHDLAVQLNQQRANSACVIMGDLMQSHLMSELIDTTLAWHTRLDLLVNNASLFIKTTSLAVKDEIWDALFQVNVKAPLLLSQQAFSPLSKTHGSIVNITDIHASTPLRGYGVYCQSKAALMMQTKVLAKEFAPHVRVNAVAPGAMAWPEGDNALNDDVKAHVIEKTPLQSHGDPFYIAQAVWSLASNAFVTGQTLAVDGGRSIG